MPRPTTRPAAYLLPGKLRLQIRLVSGRRLIPSYPGCAALQRVGDNQQSGGRLKRRLRPASRMDARFQLRKFVLLADCTAFLAPWYRFPV